MDCEPHHIGRLKIKSIFILILFSIVLAPYGFAQNLNTNLLPLSPNERIRYLSGYIESTNLINTPRFDSLLLQLKKFAESHNDTLLYDQVVYLTNAKPIFKEKDINVKIGLIKTWLEKYRKSNNLLRIGECLVAIGQLQFTNEEYAFAFANLLEADEIFKKVGYENVPNIGKYLHDFALDYYFFRNYEKVVTYMRKSIQFPKYNNNLDIQRYNTLGESYLKLNQPDSAYFYFNIAYKKAKDYKDSLWMGLCAGNIGSSLYSKGLYDKALIYFLEDYHINIDKNLPDVQQNACVNLAKNYLQLGEPAKAYYYLQLTEKFFSKPKILTFGNEQLLELAKLNYYQVAYEYYLERKDYKTALLFSKKLHTAEKIQDQKYNILQAEMAKGQLALLQSKATIEKRDLIHKKQRTTKNLIIFSMSILFLFSAVLAIFIFRNRRRFQEKNQLLLKNQLEIAEQKLHIAQLKLTEFTNRIQEKTKHIETIQKQLASYSHIDENMVSQLEQFTILTEDDWQNFKHLFEQVHVGFLQRLIQKYPTISRAEIRYLTLAKLHLSTKEMAAALGVSTQSIRTNWYRIRKKLNLASTLKVEELVSDI